MRKTKEIILTQDGQELRFIITQMPATKMQAWIVKTVAVLGAEFAEVLKNAKSQNLDFLKKIDVDKAMPLIEELWTCAQRKVGNAPQQLNARNIDDIITDINVLFELEKEILLLNLDFFKESPLNFQAEGEGTAQNTFVMPTRPTKSAL